MILVSRDWPRCLVRSPFSSGEVSERARNPSWAGQASSLGAMKLAVAVDAKSNQVHGGIIAKGTARMNMMHLETFRSSATLASPSVSL